MNYAQFHDRFPDEESCFRELLTLKKTSPVCCKNLYKRKTRPSYVCRCGRFETHPKKGTVFENSTIPLKTWFFIIYLFSNSKNGVSSMEIQRQAGVSYMTAYRMGEIIRGLMKENFTQRGVIEADELGLGGRRRGFEGRSAEKDVVMGSIERGGKLMLSVAENWDAQSMKPHFRRIHIGSTLYTDGHPAYRQISFDKDFEHKYVSHSSHEWVRGKVHTNTIECHFGQLKKTLRGTYNCVTKKKLPMYLAEREFAYNHRDDDRFQILLERSVKCDTK